MDAAGAIAMPWNARGYTAWSRSVSMYQPRILLPLEVTLIFVSTEVLFDKNSIKCYSSFINY
jgi:hypothetical protein